MSLFGDLAVVERGEHFKLPQLHLRELGLEHVPAVPVDLAALPDTLIKLGLRQKQCEQAYQSLSRTFTIADRTDRAHAFLFGTQPADANRATARASLQAFLSSNPSEISPGALAERLKEQDEALPHGAQGDAGDQLTALPLDDPTQWSMSWTTFPDVYSAGLPRLKEWAATVDVTQPDKASAAFFPTIAREGLAYNLLLLKKVDSADVVLRRRDRAPMCGQDVPSPHNPEVEIMNRRGKLPALRWVGGFASSGPTSMPCFRPASSVSSSPLHRSRALCRTRTDDPFLTMEDQGSNRGLLGPLSPQIADLWDWSGPGKTACAPPGRPHKRAAFISLEAGTWTGSTQRNTMCACRPIVSVVSCRCGRRSARWSGCANGPGCSVRSTRRSPSATSRRA